MLSDYYVMGRMAIIVARGALMLSDTREAMLYLEKCKCLDYYAELRGADAESIKDNVLADFGFDENGKLVYELGNTSVEVTLFSDLSLVIYDTKANKIVKSIPKKGADEEKYAQASAHFSDLKKNIKKVVKARNDELFTLFLNGNGRKSDSWKQSYLKNPLLHKVAELIVWQEENNHFILSENGAIDVDGNEYKISDNGVIKVAHPMEMNKEEIEKWQQYFISKGLKQPFEQIWEPVIDVEGFKKTDIRMFIFLITGLAVRKK